MSTSVEYQRLPAPGDDPALLAVMSDGQAQGELGNLINWLTTNTAPAFRPYHRIIMPNGDTLDYGAIEKLADTDEFRAWKSDS